MFTEALHTLQTPSVFCLSIIKLYICDIESFNLMEMNGKRIFKVSKSKSVRILTVGAWVIVVTICLFILWQGIKHPVALLITVPILAIVISVLVYYHRHGKVSLHVCCVNGEAAVSVVISAGSLEEV